MSYQLPVSTPFIEKAITFMHIKHYNQVDDNGLAYTNHLYQVARLICNVCCDEEMIVAALLHDTLEDTDTNYQELRHAFGDRVANLVNEVTHDGKKDEGGYYFPRLKSRDAILIKFADRMSNLSRMQGWDTNRKEHYIKRSRFWKSNI